MTIFNIRDILKKNLRIKLTAREINALMENNTRLHNTIRILKQCREHINLGIKSEIVEMKIGNQKKRNIHVYWMEDKNE